MKFSKGRELGATTALLATLAVAAPGCSTHYAPHPGPRISTTIQMGAPVYVRDGQEFPHGFAGGGLVDAVASDPEAKEAAETYYERNVGGFVATAVGAACMVGGVVVLATAHNGNDNGNNRDTSGADTVAVGALLCAVGGLIAGPLVMVSGQTYQFDAVNIYNDHVDQRLRAYPPPGPWPLVYPGAPAPGYGPFPPPATSPPAPTPTAAAPPGSPSSSAPLPLPPTPPTVP